MPADQQPLDPEAVRANVDELIKLRDSRGWQLLMVALALHAEEAKNEFVEVDLANAAELEKLQKEIKRYKWFSETLDELIAKWRQDEELSAAEGEEDGGSPDDDTGA